MCIRDRLLGSQDSVGLKYLGKNTVTYGIVVALILIAVCSIFYNSIGHQFTENTNVFELFVSTFWIVLIM